MTKKAEEFLQRQRQQADDAAWQAAYIAEEEAKRARRIVTVTNGFSLGFSIFWGFFAGGLIVAAGVFALKILGFGLLL